MALSSSLIKSTVVAALGGLLFGFDTAVIAGTTDALTRTFHLTPSGLGLTVASALVGTILDPYPAYALGRGLKTLALRVARHNASALTVARWLERDSRIERVYYPVTSPAAHPREVCAWLGMIDRSDLRKGGRV